MKRYKWAYLRIIPCPKYVTAEFLQKKSATKVVEYSYGMVVWKSYYQKLHETNDYCKL